MIKMKLSIIYFSFLIITSISVEAQNSFELLISSGWHEILGYAEEDANGNFYLTGYKTEIYSEYYCGYIVKISPEGEILKESIFCVADSAIFLNKSILIGDSLFVFGSRTSPASDYGNLWKLIFDPDLNIIQSKIQRPNPGYFEIFINTIILTGNHFVLPGYTNPDDNSPYPDIAFIELDENLDSIRSIIDVREYNQVSFDFIKNPETNGYKLFGKYYFPGNSSVYDEVVDYDSNFNLLAVDTIPWHLRNQFCAQNYDDSTYLLAGDKFMNYPNTSKMVGIMKLNYSDSLLISEYYGKGGDTNNYPAVDNNGDFITKNNIYLGGTPNLIWDQYPWQTENSWVMLNSLDSNLNLKWQQFYGGDAFYHLRFLKATRDGGCLMIATRYDENTQYQEFDVYVLKVDSSGIITSAGDHPTIPVMQLDIYPNPANDYITIHYPDIFGNESKEITIYNNLGIPVRRIPINQLNTKQKVYINDLPAGVYFVVLRIEGSKVATGKVVVR